MTAQDLYDKVNIEWNGYGSYLVIITYRGKKFKTISNNSMAYDRIKHDDINDKQPGTGGYTMRGAYSAFYDECKRNNRLGEWNY